MFYLVVDVMILLFRCDVSRKLFLHVLELMEEVASKFFA